MTEEKHQDTLRYDHKIMVLSQALKAVELHRSLSASDPADEVVKIYRKFMAEITSVSDDFIHKLQTPEAAKVIGRIIREAFVHNKAGLRDLIKG